MHEIQRFLIKSLPKCKARGQISANPLIYVPSSRAHLPGAVFLAARVPGPTGLPFCAALCRTGAGAAMLCDYLCRTRGWPARVAAHSGVARDTTVGVLCALPADLSSAPGLGWLNSACTRTPSAAS